jgi:hypothetical protein
MKAFTDHVNATLPIDNPDYILLSLVQARRETVCASTEAKAAPTADKAITTVGTAVPTTATAVTALAAAVPAAAPKIEPSPVTSEDRARPIAVTPAPTEAPPKTVQPERPMRAGGPMPSARVYDRRYRRYYGRMASRPPRVVRNLLRTFGFR